jgi:hypothetical protein
MLFKKLTAAAQWMTSLQGRFCPYLW